MNDFSTTAIDPVAAATPAFGQTSGSRRWLFILTILTGSFLLFLVQPLVARMAMPRLGGAPAVWNSAQLVYQALLLGGYAYAHFISRFAPRRQAITHIALFALAALWLPVGLIAGNPPANESVVLFVPWLLAASIGPLFLAVAAQAPLMQRWFTFHAPDADPYPLYAASNFGSFAGLISYPLIVEPMLSNSGQSWLWSGIYGFLALLVLACAATIFNDSPAAVAVADAQAAGDKDAPRLARKLRWIALAAIPSGLMLSTTTHITTDMMAIPLLWAIPLGLYLLSFSVAFAARRGLADFLLFLAPFIVLMVGGTALLSTSRQPLMMLIGSLVLLFIISIALHGLLYRDRPAPRYLTQFYLLMSVGGVLGGIFCALLAPVVFDWVYEYPLLILAAALVIPQASLLPKSLQSLGLPPHLATALQTGIALMLLLLACAVLYTYGTPANETIVWLIVGLILLGIWMVGNKPAFMLTLLATMAFADGWDKVLPRLEGSRTRSYFGIYTVYPDPTDNVQKLVHGTTLHGVQHLDPARAKEPTSYYGHGAGVGIVLDRAPQSYPSGARVGIVGLGSGTLACYARPGQQWQFYEIDPVMADLARNPRNFSYLSRCTPQAPIHIGDARLTLAGQAPASLDILVIDAFSSDAIPMHLLTREAFAVYDRILAPDGVLLVHISNRYFDLEPVLAAETKNGGWSAAARWDYPAEADLALTASVWVAMAKSPQQLASATGHAADDEPRWGVLRARTGFGGWTDDYGSVLPLLKIWRKEAE